MKNKTFIPFCVTDNFHLLTMKKVIFLGNSLIARLDKQQSGDRDYSPSNRSLSNEEFYLKLAEDWTTNLQELKDITWKGKLFSGRNHGGDGMPTFYKFEKKIFEYENSGFKFKFENDKESNLNIKTIDASTQTDNDFPIINQLPTVNIAGDHIIGVDGPEG